LIVGEGFEPCGSVAVTCAFDATGQIRHRAVTDPAAAVDAAWAAAGTLHAAASALGSRAIRQAVDSYDRAARAPYGRIPSPTPAGNSLRRAARLLSAVMSVSGDPNAAQITLVTRLAALVETIADLRDAQRHAAQAAAARRAAERLYAARGTRTRPPRGRGPPGQRSAWLALISPSRQPGYRPAARRLPVHPGPPRRVPGRHAGQDRPVAGAQRVRAMREPRSEERARLQSRQGALAQSPVTDRSGQFLCRDEFQAAIEGGCKALQR
jgi:hypothetical protein